MSAEMERYAGPCTFCVLQFTAAYIFGVRSKRPLCPTCDGKLLRSGADIATDENGKTLGFMCDGGVLFEHGIINIQAEKGDDVIG